MKNKIREYTGCQATCDCKEKRCCECDKIFKCQKEMKAWDEFFSKDLPPLCEKNKKYCFCGILSKVKPEILVFLKVGKHK